MKFYEFLKKIIVHENVLDDKYSSFEIQIGYHFKNKRLLIFALTHSSKENENFILSHFERLEFLGDSVLGLIVSESLFSNYPSNREGDLTKKKSKLVSRKFLAKKANEMGLKKFLSLNRVNSEKGINTILGNALEALIAAIYLDGGLIAAKSFIKKFILNDFKTYLIDESLINYKSIIQEYTQKHYHNVPIYQLINSEGPDHKKIFTVSISINGNKLAVGKGKNKKSAEQQAAKFACEILGLTKK